MRKILTVFLVAALVMTMALPAMADKGSGGSKGSKGSESRGPKIKSKVSVEGVITAINQGASTFTIRVLTPGHRRQVGASSAVILVQSATEVKVKGKDDDDDDDDDKGFTRRASISDLKVGDRVHVEAFRLDDGRFLALKLNVKNRKVAGQPPTQPVGAEAQGTVVAKGSNSITVLGPDGRTRTVLVSATTAVKGARTSFGEIQVNDAVVVQGTVNADGTISAQQIEVRAGGSTISGTITLKSTVGPQFLILNNVMAVNVSGDTQIISGGQARAYGDLHVGQTITVTGTPIVVAGVTVGVNARVISF